MRTQMMIMLVVGAVVFAGIAVVVGLMWWLGGVTGIAVSAAMTALLLVTYLWGIKPWHLRWGATDEEVARAMPGDELIPVEGATRAISIAAAAEDIWPWLVQIGYGRAGWYSYDWIDNDFKRSAERILPEYQDLEVGDRILMTPTVGFTVRSIDPPHAIVSMSDDGTTSWCLGLYPMDNGGTRLVSRWRPKFEITPATLFLIALSEPGTFIMEQKMLRSLRRRVEDTMQVA